MIKKQLILMVLVNLHAIYQVACSLLEPHHTYQVRRRAPNRAAGRAHHVREESPPLAERLEQGSALESLGS